MQNKKSGLTSEEAKKELKDLEKMNSIAVLRVPDFLRCSKR